MHDKDLNLVFLFPQAYRPLKRHFAGRFELLSKRCIGHIFTLSGAPCRELRIGRFLLFAESASARLLVRWLRAVRVQVLLPLRLLWRRQHVDAIVAYDPYASGAAGAILKLVLGAKLIIEINGDYHLSPPSGHRLKRWLMRRCFDLTVRAADALKILNQDQAQYFSTAYPGKPLYRFHDFVPVEYFRSLQCVQNDYLLSVGHPFALKGMDILIRAFQTLSDRHPHVRLRIMGYCPEPELQTYKALTHDDSRIEFIPPGWIEDVGEQIRGCYALVNAARTEAMGKVHLEAMACGKPVVATRTPGALACIQPGTTGLLCNVDDRDDLARQIDRLLSDPALALAMGQAGCERVLREFGEDAYFRAFIRMVEEVTGRA